MEEQAKTAFAFAQESTKQLITLATGVIALTVTFAKDIAGTVDDSAKVYLFWSWLAFFFSVVFGVWTMLALTGTLEPVDASVRPSIRGRNITVPSLLQIITFLAGLLLAVLFASKTV